MCTGRLNPRRETEIELDIGRRGGGTKRRVHRRTAARALARILVCRYTEFYAPRRRSRLTIDRDGQILCGPARKFRLYIRAHVKYSHLAEWSRSDWARGSLRRCKFSGNTSVRARARISLPFSYFLYFPSLFFIPSPLPFSLSLFPSLSFLAASSFFNFRYRAIQCARVRQPMIARAANLFPASREDSFEAERVPRLSPVASEELASRKRCSRIDESLSEILLSTVDPLENASTCRKRRESITAKRRTSFLIRRNYARFN